jgi:hypothetical protein
MIRLRYGHIYEFKVTLEPVKDPFSAGPATLTGCALRWVFHTFSTRINRFPIVERDTGLQKKHLATVASHELYSFARLFEVVKQAIAIDYVEGPVNAHITRTVKIKMPDLQTRISAAQYFQVLEPCVGTDDLASAV